MLLFYYSLWLLTIITIGLFLYAFCSNYYMENLTTLLVVLGTSSLVLVGFIAFTNIKIIYLILIFVPVVVIGIYLAYDTRTCVRNNLFEHDNEDPVSGAVRIWVESVLVFCRAGELTGKMFHKKTS